MKPLSNESVGSVSGNQSILIGHSPSSGNVDSAALQFRLPRDSKNNTNFEELNLDNDVFYQDALYNGIEQNDSVENKNVVDGYPCLNEFILNKLGSSRE